MAPKNTIIEANDVEFPQLGPLSSTGHGGESTGSSEKLVGTKVADCSGWTIDVANYLGNGGELSVKLWLGGSRRRYVRSVPLSRDRAR